MADRLEYGAYDGRGYVPLCAMLDATQLGQVVALNPGVTRVSTPTEVTGMRRYRLKVVQLTGAGPTAVSVLDLPFAPLVASAWQTVVLAAALATATRAVFDFGEGTVVMPCFMGPYIGVSLTNNGGNAATYELELWMQA